jgi:hypothetical protein
MNNLYLESLYLRVFIVPLKVFILFLPLLPFVISVVLAGRSELFGRALFNLIFFAQLINALVAMQRG